MSELAVRDLVSIRGVVCGIVEKIDGDKIVVSRNDGRVRQPVHRRDVRKLALGDTVMANQHPVAGEIVNFKFEKVAILRPIGGGDFMTYWVSVYGIVPVESADLPETEDRQLLRSLLQQTRALLDSHALLFKHVYESGPQFRNPPLSGEDDVLNFRLEVIDACRAVEHRLWEADRHKGHEATERVDNTELSK